MISVEGIRVVLTKHAEQRMQERDISTEQFACALRAQPAKLRAVVSLRDSVAHEQTHPLRFHDIVAVLVAKPGTVMVVTVFNAIDRRKKVYKSPRFHAQVVVTDGDLDVEVDDYTWESSHSRR